MLCHSFRRLAAVLSLVGCLSACVGAGDNSSLGALAPDRLSPDHFPKVTGLNLLGEEVSLPAGFDGEANLVALGFEHRHQDDIDTWIAALPEIEAEAPALRFYEVPVIYEAGPLFRWWLNNGMRIGVVEEGARRRTVTVYTDRDRFTEAVGIPGIDGIYMLLLDGDGRIVWREAGPFDERAKGRLLQRSRELAGGGEDRPHGAAQPE